MPLMINPLVGWNFPMDHLQQLILQGISAMRKDGRVFSRLFAQYASYSSFVDSRN